MEIKEQRLFGRIAGHKSKKLDPATISTDGSAIHMDNAVAGTGAWHRDGSMRNITLKLESPGENIASNSRAELGAILEALKQNETDDLEIESDSLSSLRAICNLSERYQDLNWYGVRNADILKGILVRLRTRPPAPPLNGLKAMKITTATKGLMHWLTKVGRPKQ